ncbi:MAG: DUF434 domain-containing protein [Oscillospiraceae bacterium]|nr:DUF434 domain-containing protein [Oscillospiraceae bacterium]
MQENQNTKQTRRGFVPTDARQFSEKALETLCIAGEEVRYLLNRGYSVKSATTFVGNHYLLSERQRLALARMISPDHQIQIRKAKELQFADLAGKTLYMDGFNTIITLEIAFSGSLLLECLDGTIRDLAGLRGTYTLIDKTDLAIRAIREFLEDAGIAGLVIYLDAPVSNSGRLKQRMLEYLDHARFSTKIEIINPVDQVLKQKSHVITSDAIILDACESWYNLNREIIRRNFKNYHFIKLN